MIKNREIGRNLVKFQEFSEIPPDLIKSERAMGYLTGSLGPDLSTEIRHFLCLKTFSNSSGVIKNSSSNREN